MAGFISELSDLINRHGLDNDTNTPDYILAQYLAGCIEAYDRANRRTKRHENGEESAPTQGPTQ